MNARLAALVLVLSSTALAKNWLVVAPAGVELKSMTLTRCDEADVCVRANRIDVLGGIRRESSQADFAPAAPIVLDEAYRLRDAFGTEFHLVVHAVEGDRVAIEIAPLGEPVSAIDDSGLAGRYKVTQVVIAGENTDARYPDLRLAADQSFHLGASGGSWWTDGKAVLLDGHFGSWGPGDLGAGGKTLTFHFERGPLDFTVVMTRVEDDRLQAAALPVASRASRTPGS
jgi:hypothetical protein